MSTPSISSLHVPFYSACDFPLYLYYLLHTSPNQYNHPSLSRHCVLLIFLFLVPWFSTRGRHRYEVVLEAGGQWGGPQADGSVTGMIGMVARGEAHLAINEITITGKIGRNEIAFFCFFPFLFFFFLVLSFFLFTVSSYWFYLFFFLTVATSSSSLFYHLY